MSSAVTLLLCLFLVAFVLSYAIVSAWPGLDDAYISYQYAKNLGRGNGFVFALGMHPTYGTTTPLWTLFLATTVPFGLQPHQVAPILIALFSGLSAVLVCLLGWKVLSGGLAGAIAGGFVAAGLTVYLFTSGMETALLIVLEVGLAYSLVSATTQTGRWLPGILIGLLLLTRPDTVFLIGLVVLFWLLGRKWRIAVANSVVAAGICLPWVVYALVTFGDIIPEPLRAKMATFGTSGHINLASGLRLYSRIYPSAIIVLAAIAAAAGGYLTIRREKRLAPFVLWVPVYYWALWKGGAHDQPWYYAPPLWVAAFCLAMACGAILMRAASGKGKVFSYGLAALILAGFFVGQVTIIKRVFSRPWTLTFHKEMALALRRIAKPGDTVAAMEVGNLSYWTDCRILDFMSLTFPEGLSWSRGGHRDGFIRHFRPKFVVMLSQGRGKELAQIQEHYRVAWARRYWNGAQYTIWERDHSDSSVSPTGLQLDNWLSSPLEANEGGIAMGRKEVPALRY